MKKADAIKALIPKVVPKTHIISQAEYESGLYHDMAVRHLEFLETELGMRPPRLPEMHCQAIMDVYYGGYTFNMWEEDFEKDPKIVEALEKRKRWADERQRKKAD